MLKPEQGVRPKKRVPRLSSKRLSMGRTHLKRPIHQALNHIRSRPYARSGRQEGDRTIEFGLVIGQEFQMKKSRYNEQEN